MQKESILYGIIGILTGVVLMGFAASYAVNTEHNGMMNMMGMNNNRTMSGDIDRNFIEQMIPHHESAIVMAKLAQQKSTRPEIKSLADNIITSQTDEINSMKQWYKDWYGTDVPTVTNHGMQGGGMMNSHAGTDSLNSATDFDKAFLEEMIPHHQMAVMMANMLDIATKRPEMKKLANNITSSQTKEINDMQSWQQQWEYKTLPATGSHNMNNMGH